MSLFGNLGTDGLEESQDRLGGFSLFDTDVYSGKVKVAYAGESEGGAMNITLVLDLSGKEYRETIYITNKKKENFFYNKDDKTKKVPLPGFTLINDLCLITTGKPLTEQDHEEKAVNVYDYDQKKELPKAVQVLTELIDKEISVGIVKAIENKNAKNDQTGEYEPTAETREVNNIDKMYDTASKLTVVEAQNGKNADTAEFWDAWVKKNKGQTRDKTKKGVATTGAPGSKAPAAGQAPGSAAPRKSLFGK